jgi:thiosulfate dehydrogenase
MKPENSKRWNGVVVTGFCLLALGSLVITSRIAGQAKADPQKTPEVNLCDGSGTVALPNTGESAALDRGAAQANANALLAAWMERNPERAAAWNAEMAAVRGAGSMPSQTSGKAAGSAAEKQPVKTTARDKLIWNREQKKMTAEGYRLFHSPTALGGTIGISCDMCHPDSSNTHPETYPKFQTQLKKVALLRDMINWCIENPEKGKPLAQDDDRLRAVEAYIYSARQGVALDPGKH